ncbi:hypothetical protein [Lactobacillus amylovorus]|nr:hypothetical protein [Lactobacillus amylovorus]MDB6238370.1 hypothetical protein [Lactobacillus amylovorus]
MLNKRKFLIKLCAALPAALLLTTTPVLADENDQTNHHKHLKQINKM